MWQTLPTVPLSQVFHALRQWMDELRDALCTLQTKTDLKGPQWLKYWWILMFSSDSKSKTSGKVVRCRAGKAYLQQCSTPCHPPRPAVWEGRWFVFLGEEQVREQGRVRPWLNPVQPDLIWVTGTLPAVTSACPGQGTAGATTPRAKLFPVPPGRAQMSRTFQHKNRADSPKDFPATVNKIKKGGDLGEKTNNAYCRGFRRSEIPFESEFLIW